MIPKKIHYCWFGGNPIPEKDQRCIDSWKKFCPDYEIIQWNESNYDITKNTYMYQAYQLKKWGFVPDYARFDIIYEQGGFYLDTDVELVKALDVLRENKAYMGFEGNEWISPGLGFGAEAGNEVVKGLRDMYADLSFYHENGEVNLTPSPHYITGYLEKEGMKRNNQMQMVGSMCIYPTDYFCPKDYYSGKMKVTKNTFSIHWFNASWQTPHKKRMLKLRRVLGDKLYFKLVDIKNVLVGKNNGK